MTLGNMRENGVQTLAAWVPRSRLRSPLIRPMLILKRASKSRPSGEWTDVEYDVYDGDRHIGRILLVPQAPEGQPWFWTITARVPQYPHDRGYAVSREQAMADFKARWERRP